MAGEKSCRDTTSRLAMNVNSLVFLQLCDEAQKNDWGGITIAYPWVLGDTYDEVMESLSRLALAGLSVTIAKPN
jgi:hypothetical protein